MIALMGDTRRQKKRYTTPRHPWTEEALSENLRIIGGYGLRSKRELRRAEFMLRQIRRSARSYQGLTGEGRTRKERELLSKLYRMGLVDKESSLDNVLSLTTSNLLERRLQTLVMKKGLANTLHHARQLIVHRKILVDGRAVSVPGYIVGRKEESDISLQRAS